MHSEKGKFIFQSVPYSKVKKELIDHMTCHLGTKTDLHYKLLLCYIDIIAGTTRQTNKKNKKKSSGFDSGQKTRNNSNYTQKWYPTS